MRKMNVCFKHVNITSEAAKIWTTTMYFERQRYVVVAEEKADMERWVCFVDNWGSSRRN